MLEKRKFSALNSARTAFRKEMGNFDRDCSDIQLLLSNISQMCSSCKAVERVATRGIPEILLVSFDDVPDQLISNFIHEGQQSALQIRHFEKNLFDEIYRMRELADDALELIVDNEISPELDVCLAGNQVEQILELQDVFKCYEREYRRLKDIIDSCLINESGLLALTAQTLKSGLRESELISKSDRKQADSRWFDDFLVATAAKEWGQNKFIANNPRVDHFRHATV